MVEQSGSLDWPSNLFVLHQSVLTAWFNNESPFQTVARQFLTLLLAREAHALLVRGALSQTLDDVTRIVWRAANYRRPAFRDMSVQEVIAQFHELDDLQVIRFYNRDWLEPEAITLAVRYDIQLSDTLSIALALRGRAPLLYATPELQAAFDNVEAAQPEFRAVWLPRLF